MRQTFSKVLTARNEFHQGMASFKYLNGFWCCYEAAPCLQWLIHMDSKTAKIELVKRGYSWNWL